MSVPRYDAVIIGGGFFGCSIAIALAQSGQKVLLCEQTADLLTAASYHNQARIHNGYHYPRSVLTALRSRVNFPHWVEAYRGCVVDDFEAYYAIAQRFSKVSARQFQAFMERVGAPLDPAPNAVQQWFNPALIEQVYRVKESVFDAVKLRELMLQGLADARVEVRLQSRATKVQAAAGGGIECTLEEAETLRQVIAGHVYNCTYSRINELLISSQFPQIRLKHELAEMALVEVPERLRQVGITVMCGPFFSLMPFPARKLHTLSHVRYTPHTAWEEPREPGQPGRPAMLPPSHFRFMQSDAQRFLPLLEECRQVDSLWEVKTILPSSEQADSRPILFRRNCGLPNLHCVMGAKIDNVFDALAECLTPT